MGVSSAWGNMSKVLLDAAVVGLEERRWAQRRAGNGQHNRVAVGRQTTLCYGVVVGRLM
jgi:hypothetical protein